MKEIGQKLRREEMIIALRHQ